MKLVIDITQEEIDYAQMVGLHNIVELSMTDPHIGNIIATEKHITFSTFDGWLSHHIVKTPTTLRTFLHRYHRKVPVFPIRVEVNYN